MATTFPDYPASTFEDAVDLTIFAGNQLHEIINGDASTEIETENGVIPSVRKALTDNLYFKDPIPWESGKEEVLFNQLRSFSDEEVNRWYFAPSATMTSPVKMGETPINDNNWKIYGDNSLREEIESEKGTDLIGYKFNNEQSKITTVSKKLNTSINLAVDFVEGGVISGNPDLTVQLQNAIIAAYENKIPTVEVNGVFQLSNTVLIYPGVHIKGFGADFTYITPANNFPQNGIMFRMFNPNTTSGIRRNSHSRISDMVINGGGTSRGITCVDIGDSLSFKLSMVQFSSASRGISYNKYIYDTRVEVDGNITYPNAIDTVDGGMSYFGTVEQCDFQSCIDGQAFFGVVNRITCTSNTYRDCQVAYNFSNQYMIAETNTFISDNIEGCHSAFEWSSAQDFIYNNTWITTSIDNSNNFTCLIKDPGRQTFINLSMFPYNDGVHTAFYNIFPNRRSDIIGSNCPSATPTLGVGHITRETIEATAGIRNKVFGSKHFDMTITKNSHQSIIVEVPGLTSGAALMWSLDVVYPTLFFTCYSTSANAVTFVINNPTDEDVVINSNFSVSGISKSYLS